MRCQPAPPSPLVRVESCLYRRFLRWTTERRNRPKSRNSGDFCRLPANPEELRLTIRREASVLVVRVAVIPKGGWLNTQYKHHSIFKSIQRSRHEDASPEGNFRRIFVIRYPVGTHTPSVGASRSGMLHRAVVDLGQPRFETFDAKRMRVLLRISFPRAV